MFGGLQRPAPLVLKPRPVPKIIDVPGINIIAHMAPTPATCYNYKMMQYQQRKKEFIQKKEDSMVGNIVKDQLDTKYMKHFQRTQYTRTLNDRVNNKMKEYDEKIETRREKLRGIIWKEERELIREVVEDAQMGEERKIQEKIEKIKQIKERKEAERLEIVKEKKLQQYLDRCTEFRPVIENQRLRETKAVQLVQIQENESRKESERELERMWHELTLKEQKALDDREQQDKLMKLKEINEFKNFSDLQMKARAAYLEEQRIEKLEEGKRLDKLREEIQQEERAALQEKRSIRNALSQTINAQVKEREEMLNRIAADDLAIKQAYDKLADEELEKERLKIKQKVSTAYEDMIKYKEYLADLEQKRLEDAKKMDEIVKSAMKEIHRKHDKEKCDFEKARKALQESVLETRAKQIEYRQKQEIEQEKLKQAEKALMESTRQQNEQLRNEYERQKRLSEVKYREVLKKQIEYGKICKEREQDEMRRILEASKVEDKLYDDIVSEVLKGKIKISEVHPFRNVINQENCACPKALP